MKRKYIIVIIVLVVVILIGFQLFVNKRKINAQNQAEDKTSIVIPVKTDTAHHTPIKYTIEKTGHIIGENERNVVLPVGGIVQRVMFELGDQVKAGQVLAIVDNKSNQLELEKTQTKITKLKKDLETYTELYKGNAATEEKVLELQENYDLAVNEAAQLRKKISDAHIKAPITGTIASKKLEEGVFANAGNELTSVVNLSTLKVKVSLTETEVYQVELHQQVSITTNIYPGVTFKGTISFISPQADDAHNYPVEITLNNSDKYALRSGTFVYVDLSQTLEDKTLTIDRAALIENQQQPTVYLVKNSTATLTQVATGRSIVDRVEILDGLHDGDIIVTTGQINLKNGTEVKVAQ